jgi:hypothetical protein
MVLFYEMVDIFRFGTKITHLIETVMAKWGMNIVLALLLPQV